MMERLVQLPGFSDPDQFYMTGGQMRTSPYYVLSQHAPEVDVYDPVWGECHIGDWPGDEIFSELMRNPLVRRSSGVEQLSLPESFATMPGSTGMTRLEHLMGSVVFTRKMIEKARNDGIAISDHNALRFQLRTFFSDLGQTAFSHIGDFIFQGVGDKEDLHDQELAQILEVGGVNDILRQHDNAPEEVCFPDITDWTECPAPDLCTDRVDYGMREIMRWLQPSVGNEERNVDMFSIDEQQRIIMRSKEDAMAFATNFLLLATEHWSQPMHRLQLHLFGELIRSVISMPGSGSAGYYGIGHPRDAIYSIDNDILAETRSSGDMNYDLYALMLDIARAQRKIFAHGRTHELQEFTSRYRLHRLGPAYEYDESADFPDPIKTRGWTDQTWLKPHNIAITQIDNLDDVPDFGKLEYTLDTLLPALKRRYVDPLFYDENGEVRRLSETDETYANFVLAQTEIQQRKYVARLYGDPQFLHRLKANLASVAEGWEDALARPRATADTMGRFFHDIGASAIATAGLIDYKFS